MAGAPTNMHEFLDLVRKSGVVDEKRFDAHVQRLKDAGLLPPEPAKIAGVLIRDGFLTQFQAENIMQGKWRRFSIGKYKVLERIGSGGMGQVYLCEHKLMRRRVAIKVLPTAKAADDAARERFYREARAVAALDHPNIVHAYDIDQDENLHFLVMEYVDGANLQDIVKKGGPLDITRACHYIRQAALGLEHAHQANLVHRDIKPGNILVDRAGVVKVLDMGLARFFNDEDDVLTKKFDDNVLGTADYLAPEQAIDSHAVDIRADIYSLGATFYFLLTGKTPYGEGTVAQKLLRHQTQQPKALAELRPDVPADLQAIVRKMMAKEAADRYDVPAQVAEALAPFTQTAIGPPPEGEMPRLSPAASGAGPQDGGPNTAVMKVPPSGPRLNLPPSGASPRPAPPAAKPSVAAPSPSVEPVLAAKLQAPPPARVQAEAPVATLPPPEEEEKAPWETFVSDTHEMAAKDDTAPRSVRTPRLAKGAELAKRKERIRLWAVVGVLTLFLVTAVIILLAKFASNPRVGSDAQRLPLTVSRDSAKGSFKTIRQALHAAQVGDVIEIHDLVHEENLVVDEHGAGVTLRAAAGVKVRWIPAKKDDKTPLIRIAKSPHFHIKGAGITLDGMIDESRRVRDLVFITLKSPGLTIDDLQFINIGQNAVKVMNAEGAAGQPIRLLNLSVPAGEAQKGAVGVAFDADAQTTPPINDYIEVDEFRGVASPVHLKNEAVLGKNVSRPQ